MIPHLKRNKQDLYTHPQGVQSQIVENLICNIS